MIAGVATTLAGCATNGTQTITPTAPPADGGDGTPTPTGDSPTTAASPPGERRLGVEVVAEGFPAPLGVEVPLPGHVVVVDQRGRLYRIADGAPEPYLDIRDRLAGDLGSEEGLLGAAFHPNFAENGRLFVRYSADPRADTPDDYDHTFVLAEFTADPTAETVDPTTERTILEIPQPQSNHNAGSVVFGPDGYLYVGTGDGGGANDQGMGHVSDWYDPVAGGNGQDVTENLLGSVLRIDVDGTSTDQRYAIPEDNPLVGVDGLDEHFAWGLRNPWRMSFGPDGRLFVADVGQNQWEEISLVERGGNYGWNVYEGAHCFQRNECPSVTPDGERLRPPIVEYGHGDDPVSGIAVIGGDVYQGSALPAFEGEYVFADWQAGDRVFVAQEADSGPWPSFAVPVEGEAFGPQVTAFGTDSDGELLVCSIGSTGRLLRLTPP